MGGPVDRFHALLSSVLAASHNAVPTHSLLDMKTIVENFPFNIRLYSITSSRFEGLLAGALVYDFGHIAHSQYLASSCEGKSLGALDFLLDKLFTQEYKHCRYFSLGISTENHGKILNQGLAFYKESLGGRGIVHDLYEIVFQ